MIEKPCPGGNTAGAGLLLAEAGKEMKKVEENAKRVLTDASSACIIIQVANGNSKRKSEFPSII